MNPITRFAPLAVTTALALALGACATLPPPTEQLSAARAAIESADVSGAAKSAPVELTQAREKMNAAELAVRDNNSERARRLAEQAQVDAQLAQAKASTARSQEGLSQAEAAVRSLREETNRAVQRAADVPNTPGTTSSPVTTPSPATPTR